MLFKKKYKLFILDLKEKNP